MISQTSCNNIILLVNLDVFNLIRNSFVINFIFSQKSFCIKLFNHITNNVSYFRIDKSSDNSHHYELYMSNDHVCITKLYNYKFLILKYGRTLIR